MIFGVNFLLTFIFGFLYTKLYLILGSKSLNKDAGSIRHGSITNKSVAPSLGSNFRLRSEHSDDANVQRSGYSTYKLDENCSVVDPSMKWEGFGGLYKYRTPFVAERTLSRESKFQKGRNKSLHPIQSSNSPLPSPPITPRTQISPSNYESQESYNFIEASRHRETP